jgi:hypothetical protein
VEAELHIPSYLYMAAKTGCVSLNIAMSALCVDRARPGSKLNSESAHIKHKVPPIPGIECTQRFSSTATIDRRILLGAAWHWGGTQCSMDVTDMDLEKELLDAFDRVVHDDFPNPQRTSCPGREVLLKLARRSADTQFACVLAHIRQCAPCFDELKELRSRARNQSPEGI